MTNIHKNVLLKSILLLSFLCIAHVKAQTAFPSCPTTMYLTQYSSSGGTALYTLDNVSNPLTITQIGTTTATTIRLNGVGYNPIDNFIYGMNTVDFHLYKVDANGNVFDLGLVTGLPNAAYLSGDIDDAGNYYVKSNGGTNTLLYKINVTTKIATPIILSTAITPVDIAYSKVDKLFYGVDGATNKLFSLDISKTPAVVTLIGLTVNGTAFGAMYTDGVTGAVYGNANVGNFYSFNKTTGLATLVSASVGTAGNDGAHCVNARIVFGAEVAVTKDDGKTLYNPGISSVYTVVVTNNGPFTALGATVNDLVPAGIPAANVSYTAVASTGSDTSVIGIQTGAINDIVNIQKSGTITYTVSILIPNIYTGNLSNTATVTLSPNNSDSNLTNNTATDTDTLGACYFDANGSAGIDTKHGITLLKRAGANNDNWPMVRKSALTVLESNTKGFVITRVAGTAGILKPLEGMMVYDTVAKCLKINSDGTTAGWSCFSTPTCP